jgi:putative restriction endonuclease
MREVAAGDMVFSFADTLIKAVGLARSYCNECPKPLEFGGAGPNWDQIGWRVEIEWARLIHQIRPGTISP